MLAQTDELGSTPVAYTSRKLIETEQQYSTAERELLAILHSLRTRRPYLHGLKFVIQTNHHPLMYPDTQKTYSRRQGRWVAIMQEFDNDRS